MSLASCGLSIRRIGGAEIKLFIAERFLILMAKLIHERWKCIGCGACVAVADEFWEMGDDGKSQMKIKHTSKKTKDGEMHEGDITAQQVAPTAKTVEGYQSARRDVPSFGAKGFIATKPSKPAPIGRPPALLMPGSWLSLSTKLPAWLWSELVPPTPVPVDNL